MWFRLPVCSRLEVKRLAHLFGSAYTTIHVRGLAQTSIGLECLASQHREEEDEDNREMEIVILRGPTLCEPLVYYYPAKGTATFLQRTCSFLPNAITGPPFTVFLYFQIFFSRKRLPNIAKVFFRSSRS